MKRGLRARGVCIVFVALFLLLSVSVTLPTASAESWNWVDEYVFEVYI